MRSFFFAVWLLLALSVTRTAAADPVTVSSMSLTFTGTGLGVASPPQTLTYTNMSMSAATVTGITLGGANASDFAVMGLPSFPVTLQTNGTLSISVTCTPSAAGARAGTITATVSGQANIVTTLAGSGLAPNLTVSPNPIAVGDVPLAQTPATTMVTLTNTSTSTIHVNNLSL